MCVPLRNGYWRHQIGPETLRPHQLQSLLVYLDLSDVNSVHAYTNTSTRIVQTVQRLVTGWTVRGSNPGEGEIIHIRPHRLWGSPNLLYNGYQVIPGGKRPERDVDHPPPSSVEVKEREGLYLYSFCVQVIVWTLPFYIITFQGWWTHTFQAVKVILLLVHICAACSSWGTATNWAEAWHRSPVSSSEVMNE